MYWFTVADSAIGIGLMLDRSHQWDRIAPTSHWSVTRSQPRSTARFWLPRVYVPSRVRPNYGLLLPLWFPFALFAGPTVWLWCRDRRPRSGHCLCGYNLTGNTTGVCPECGRAVDP